MTSTEWTSELFASIDEMDAEKFSTYLDENATFTFGNAPAVTGREAVTEAVTGFFGTIAGLSHDIQNTWTIDDDVVVQGEVTYTRQDQSKVTLPFMNHFGMKGELVGNYQIYADVAPLYSQS